MIDLTKLSKAVSRALRHQPWLFELELDNQGWTRVEDLLSALRKESPEWTDLGMSDLRLMIAAAAKPRHEIQGQMIRALYGHSTPGALVMVRSAPPDELFHGTSPESIRSILTGGLLPMGRQSVHMSKDPSTAFLVGGRKSPHPVVLSVDATSANSRGVMFFRGSDIVWLAKHVPAEFIRIYKAP
ncbi:RNA 2'-phosphotransferase [Arthrobacter sp.]|uniref:RNA 2'-phosphotransferase n=1 Tax=Arthrobacter sp. TaxID=1667 RepID=UPI002811850F|nr:RNA 2'-phosphotransferase [Arthrobacter sp.]